MQIKVTRIHDPVHRQEYVWIHAHSAKQFDDYLKTAISNYSEVVEQTTDDEDCEGETIDLVIDGKLVIFFWFNKKDATAIVHELAHAMFKSMRSRGVTLSEESEESFCYLLSFLYSEVLKVLCKKSLDKKQKS